MLLEPTLARFSISQIKAAPLEVLRHKTSDVPSALKSSSAVSRGMKSAKVPGSLKGKTSVKRGNP